jgi:hypothetical protein
MVALWRKNPAAYREKYGEPTEAFVNDPAYAPEQAKPKAAKAVVTSAPARIPHPDEVGKKSGTPKKS